MPGCPDLGAIELLAFDVDGVLTDGTLVVHSDGSESKNFNSLDGHGIRLWIRAGLKVAFITGRYSEPVNSRARELGVDYVFQNCHNKLPVLIELMQKLGLAARQVAFIGDDLPDLPPMRHVGFAVAVANAVLELKQHADYVTVRPGGSGAVREVIEYVLKNTGRWQQLMQRYLS